MSALAAGHAIDALPCALLESGSTATRAEPISVIQASVGNRIQMPPLPDVLAFEVADKYLRVPTTAREYLIRTPLKDLLPRLDQKVFWQLHRGAVVCARAIDSVLRDDAGRLALTLCGRGDRVAVSRVYACRFKAM